MPPVTDLIVMTERPQFQFSVAALLLTMTVTAIALAVAIAIGNPFSKPIFQIFLAFYLAFLGAWAILRGPRVCRNLLHFARQRRQLRDKRTAIELELRAIKEARARREATQKTPD
jgi:hypothetical protein